MGRDVWDIYEGIGFKAVMVPNNGLNTIYLWRNTITPNTSFFQLPARHWSKFMPAKNRTQDLHGLQISPAQTLNCTESNSTHKIIESYGTRCFRSGILCTSKMATRQTKNVMAATIGMTTKVWPDCRIARLGARYLLNKSMTITCNK